MALVQHIQAQPQATYEPFLTPNIEAHIIQLAEGLSRDEVCQYLGIEFSSLDIAEQQRFMACFNRGRVMFKLYAVNKMKDAMNGRDGFKAALATLIRFADEWPEANGLEDTDLRTFKFYIGEPEPKAKKK